MTLDSRVRADPSTYSHDSDVDEREAIRRAVRGRLRGVGRPDTRFVYDFSNFIADYPGSERIADTLRALPFWEGSGPVFVTPDNCLESLRAELVREGRPLLQTIAVAMGFHYFPPNSVQPELDRFAGTLDGAMILAQQVSLDFVRSLGPLDFVVTGACAVNRSGIRFGKGHGFFDIEWGILRELGIADDDTPVIACIHDCQLVDADLPADEHDTVVDWIVTPTETIKVTERIRKPTGIHWDRVTPSMLEEIAPLAELDQVRESGAS
jgi:5-formyltetrahydrofolate cyclo-ligase